VFLIVYTYLPNRQAKNYLQMKKITLICVIISNLCNLCYAQLFKKAEQDFKKKFFIAENYLSAENYARAIPIYLQLDSMDPMNSNINWKLGICYLNSTTEKTKAIPYLEKAILNTTVIYDEDSYAERNAFFVAYYDLAKTYHLNYQLDTAIKTYEKFKTYLSTRQTKTLLDVDRRIEMCNNAKELMAITQNVIITNLGQGINSSASEHSAVISADESTLIFTSRREGSTGGQQEENGQYYEDIYISHKVAGEWSAPVQIDTNINTDGHDANIGLSVDGQQLFIYKDDYGDGNIYSSLLEGDRWSVPEKLGSSINSKAWETHAVLSGDGNTLYFVSDRKGGYGGRDIYKCIKLPRGEWSLGQNLGPVINTPYDEDAPFIHPDGIQLFFSSNGHKSMGGFDIFYSELYEGDKWSEPINIGYPINTTDDDIFYITSADGKRAYYTSTKPGGFGEKDIYLISLPGAEEKSLTILKGTLLDRYGDVPSGAEIIVTDNETGELVGIYTPNSKTGKYLFILPEGGNYTVSYDADGFFPFSTTLIIPEKSSYEEIDKPIELTPPIELKSMVVGEKVILDKIFFDYDKATLRPESNYELEKLFNLLSDNPDLAVEISGHTDAKGTNKYNMQLSRERAQSVVDYMVEMGIEPGQLIAKGYGNTQPIASNTNPDGTDNPEGRAMNRRIELKITDLPGK